MYFFLLAYILLFTIFGILVFGGPILTCTVSAIGSGKRGQCTYGCSQLANLTAIMTDESSNDLTDSISNHRKSGSQCKFDYLFTSGGYGGDPSDVLITVEGIGTFTVPNVQCIFEDVWILSDPPKLARNIIVGDSCYQLNGSKKKIKKIVSSPIHEIMYEYEGAILSEWHPVRLPNESKYIVAKHHPSLRPVTKKGFVYNFELENETDDILFLHSQIIAESLNNLPHGTELIRN